MNGHIENSERGITLSKQLAWGLFTGLVMAGLWLGVELGTVKTTLSDIDDAFTELKEERVEFRREVRAEIAVIENQYREQARRTSTLERAESADRARTDELSRSLQRIERLLADMAERLREQEQGDSP